MPEQQAPAGAAERREALKELYLQARGCTRCPQLASTRTTVVFGSGNADADLMFVGEAPGASEDQQGLPFVGRAGRLLDQLLEEIGLARADVFVANTLKCLRYDAPVQLGDGSWERIGRLVRSRYAGDVMSVDADGRILPRPVVGWHASPLGGRRVFALRYRSSKRTGRGRTGIQLTGDHEVLTERGYVAVEDLRPDDRVATGQGLSELAHDVACGTPLGDGSTQRKSAWLTFSHSAKQRQYARFKASLLEELGTVLEERTVAARAGGPQHDEILLSALGGLGLRAKAMPRRLYSAGAATEGLSELIAPSVPPTMRYKLHPEVAARVRFDAARFATGFPQTVYDTVDVEDVTDSPRGDPTFFCIDVAETHNFVTSGGVVHNCRPPGNRDPLPVELDNCHEYLLRQVELIEPSVICTLGNFATKLLRGDPTGITRLHGRPEVIELGARAVRLYPLYHPAAALYTPSLLATLREDFAGIPALLGQGPPDQPRAAAPPEPAAELEVVDLRGEEASQLDLF